MRPKIFPFLANPGEACLSVGLIHHEASSDRVALTFDNHTLLVHLGGANRASLRRQNLSYEGIFARGELTLVPAGSEASCTTETALDILVVELNPAFVNAVIAAVAPDEGRSLDLPGIFFRFDDPVCRELSLSMLREVDTGGAADRVYVEAVATIIVLRLARLSRVAVVRPTRSALPSSVLRRAKDFLRNEMKANPSLEEVARAAGMGVYHFSRMFKRSTGLAPHQYLSEIRLQRAKSLLTEGRQTIAEVARETGFANPSQFSAFFRRRAGVTPSDFRLTARIES